ncbi:MAG: phosphoribosyltransferase family protein [Candidatus Daviesbacteria bacterium]|nr:phosphoribosyltransferase family protein [Candidatus Daviesbacteria bacterium]
METYFRDRYEAGKKLAGILKPLKNQKVVVYALPRGGVIIGAEIARELDAPFDLIITRKIGHPNSLEYAIGAIAEDGHSIFEKEQISEIDPDYIITAAEKEKEEAKRRRQIYLEGKKPISSKNKIAILVDDGVATGLTMKIAIKELQMHYKPKKIIVAVGIISDSVADELESEGVEIITLIRENNFLGAIGEYYQDFSPVEDTDVIKIMKGVKIHASFPVQAI